MTRTPLHTNLVHESATRHVTGQAQYIDDFPEAQGQLHGRPFVSTRAHARILGIDTAPAHAVPGVVAVLTAPDLPGVNECHHEPLFAEGLVECVGQFVGLVVATSPEAARKGAEAVVIEYEDLPAIFDTKEAVEQGSFLTGPFVIERGEVASALASAALRLSGELETGGQEHFYLETQAAAATPGEHGTLHVISSTQHPSEVQANIATVLGAGRHQIVVECPRMGGAFGGKESQAGHLGAMAALGARATGRPVKVRFDRDLDMASTGKRHPWYSRYDAGFDTDGKLVAFDVHTYANGGWSLDLSIPILQRCLFHLDNAYWIPNARFEGRAAKTHLPSNTAFRGFGGPQGVVLVEEVMNRAAEHLGLDPAELRRRNFYGNGENDVTPYGERVENNRIHRLDAELMESSQYAERRAGIERFNAGSAWVKRGIGYQPLKFGISFTLTMLNQAGALVLVYADGSVQLSHGGTEMGQGLHTKMLAICAHELGVPAARVRVMNTATDKVPNTSATAASSGADLNGQAVAAAARTVRERLRPLAAELLGIPEADAAGLAFEDGVVYLPGTERSIPFDRLATAAYERRIQLSATGFYATPDIGWDPETGKGKPFHYYAFGGAVTEVEVNGLTGEHRILRTDILHDVGRSLLPAIDRGQVEGGFVQGVGWVTMEELRWDAKGRLLTRGPSTYKVPAIGDAPTDFRVALLDRAETDDVIHGSKAVGEPPFLLGISVLTALRHAVGAFGTGGEVRLPLPATPEALLRAIESRRSAGAGVPQGQHATEAASVD